MKLFGLDLSFSGGEPDLKVKVRDVTNPHPVRPALPALAPSTVMVMLQLAKRPVSKIELLKLYEAAFSAPGCPMSPALSNYILDISLNDDDVGVRHAARDVVIKSLGHETILPAWDANRDGNTEEITDVVATCLKTASDPERSHEIRYDAFVVAEKIITRLPEHAVDSVRTLLNNLALQNHQLADKAQVLLYYIDEQVKDEKLKDAASALRDLAARGKAIEFSAKGYKS